MTRKTDGIRWHTENICAQQSMVVTEPGELKICSKQTSTTKGNGWTDMTYHRFNLILLSFQYTQASDLLLWNDQVLRRCFCKMYFTYWFSLCSLSCEPWYLFLKPLQWLQRCKKLSELQNKKDNTSIKTCKKKRNSLFL